MEPRRRVALQQGAGGHVEERGVDSPQEHADERDDLRLGAEVQRGGRTRTRSSRWRRSAAWRSRSPTTASDSPVSTSPMPNTVWSSAKVSSDAPEHVADVQRLEHAEHRPQRVDAARPPPASSAALRTRRASENPSRSSRHVDVACSSGSRGTGSTRIRSATSAPTRKVAASAMNAPSRPHRALTSAAAIGPTHDGEVLRAAEQRVGRHQLRVGHDPGWDGVERRGRPAPRSDRAAARAR